ncbi:unnamed protein product [[Candida] boidinii]|nr:unnamed protein product [[Candida] boidinii]
MDVSENDSVIYSPTYKTESQEGQVKVVDSLLTATIPNLHFHDSSNESIVVKSDDNQDEKNGAGDKQEEEEEEEEEEKIFLSNTSDYSVKINSNHKVPLDGSNSQLDTVPILIKKSGSFEREGSEELEEERVPLSNPKIRSRSGSRARSRSGSRSRNNSKRTQSDELRAYRGRSPSRTETSTEPHVITRSGKIIGANTDEEIKEAKQLLAKEDALLLHEAREGALKSIVDDMDTLKTETLATSLILDSASLIKQEDLNPVKMPKIRNQISRKKKKLH